MCKLSKFEGFVRLDLGTEDQVNNVMRFNFVDHSFHFGLFFDHVRIQQTHIYTPDGVMALHERRCFVTIMFMLMFM